VVGTAEAEATESTGTTTHPMDSPKPLAMLHLMADPQAVSLLLVVIPEHLIHMLLVSYLPAWQPFSFPIIVLLPDQTVLTTITDGGYQNYLALWYQALAAQQAQGGGDPSNPPGSA